MAASIAAPRSLSTCLTGGSTSSRKAIGTRNCHPHYNKQAGEESSAQYFDFVKTVHDLQAQKDSIIKINCRNGIQTFQCDTFFTGWVNASFALKESVVDTDFPGGNFSNILEKINWK